MPVSATTYLRYCVLSPLMILAIAIPFNYAIDPYGIYHYDKMSGWIHDRPCINSNDYLHKAYAIRQAKADVLLLGSSRVAFGLDACHPVLPDRTYNLALMGSGVYENWRYLQHASSGHMPKLIIMGIDPDFFDEKHRSPGIFLEDRLKVLPDGQANPKSAFADLSATLMSFSALKSSFDTVTSWANPVFKDQKGFLGLPFSDHKRLAMNVLLDNAKEQAHNVPSYKAEDGQTPQMDAFQAIALFCAREHIRLAVFVNPLHASTLDRYTADWLGYRDWIKAVARTIEFTPGLNGSLWDFAGYNEMSVEPFPKPTDVYSQMKYYLESSHYCKIVGDMVLNKMLTNNGPVNFGLRVTMANIDRDLQRLDSEKTAWHTRGQYVILNAGTRVTEQ